MPKIKYILETLDAPVFDDLAAKLDPLSDIADLIERSIAEEPPISVTDGGVIKTGYNDQLDQYRDAMNNGKQWIAQLQAKEREATGISNLKIGYNHVFGYYIEVTKANLSKLPTERYERKQTLTNAERFSTPELKAKEALILGAQEKSTALEYDLFVGDARNRQAGNQSVAVTGEGLVRAGCLAEFCSGQRRLSFCTATDEPSAPSGNQKRPASSG